MIKKCRLQDIPGGGDKRKTGPRLRDIEEFIASGEDCCEIVLKDGENPRYVSTTYNGAICKRQYYSDICYAVLREGRVYLIRKEEKRIKEEKQCSTT